MKLPKELTAFIRKEKRLPKIDELAGLGLTQRYYTNSGGKDEFAKELAKAHPALGAIIAATESAKSLKLLITYKKLLKSLGRHPIQQELRNAGIHHDSITIHFGNLEGMRRAFAEAYPDIEETLFSDDEFTPDRFAALEDTVTEYKRFVITTVIAGARVNKKFYRTLKHYCEVKNALLLCIPIADPVSNRSKLTKGALLFDPCLRDEAFVFDDLKLNSNFYVSGLKLQAKAVRPATGLGRIARKTGSFVYGSPKQSSEVVASSTYPTKMITPGALTHSDYTTEYYISQRTAYIANSDHRIGALVVEIDDGALYYTRELQSDTKGGFVDLAQYYCGEAAPKKVSSFFSMADLHSYVKDRSCFDVWGEIVQELDCSAIGIHDGLDGIAFNPHEKGRHQSKARNNVTVKAEFDELACTVKEIINWRPNTDIYWVPSNHDNFATRWIESGDYVFEPDNALIGHQMWLARHSGLNVIEDQLVKRGIHINFLNERKGMIYAGCQVGTHGHLGANGSRGNGKGHQTSYICSITGHEHTPSHYNDTWVNGTTTGIGEEAPAYAKGPSSWLQTSTVRYETGHTQQITNIKGKWRLDE